MSAGGEHEHSEPERFIFPVVALIVGLILDEVNKRISFIGIPDSVMQFVFAMITSFMLNKFLPSSVAHEIDTYSWTSLEPQIILMLMLPPLIFESSFKINSHMFFAKLRMISTLTVCVYVMTLIISTLVMLPLLMTTQQCSISAVFLFVCIIVATDPVAVVSMLEQYGAPHRLRILIEGESLLNDGLALTAYRVLVEVLRVETDPAYKIDYVTQGIGLFMCLVISPIFGAVGAYILAWVVSRIHENKKKQALIVVSVFGMFIIVDKIKGSAALGLVFFGVTLNYYKEMMAPETSKMALELWQTLGYWANNVIFIFAGYTVGREMFTTPDTLSFDTYLPVATFDNFTLIQGVLISPIPLFARIASIYMFYKLHKVFSSQKLPPKTDFVILAYAGLRGALGLILAVELTKTRGLSGSNDGKMILLLTCSSTFTCLVFQGVTFSAIATKEGTTRRSKYVKDFTGRLIKLVSNTARSLMNVLEWDRNSYLVGTNWDVARKEVTDTLNKHSELMSREVMQADTDQEDLWEEEVKLKRMSKKEVTEAKIGFYGILLSRARDAWARGAVSGSTVHVISALLEHGIDEGSIVASDIEEHLDRIELGPISRYLSIFAEWCYKKIEGPSWLNWFAEMGTHPLFENSKPDFVIKRDLEKWWIFHTCALTLYLILTVWAVFIAESKGPAAIIYVCFWVVFLTTVIESLYCNNEQKKWKKEKEEQNYVIMKPSTTQNGKIAQDPAKKLRPRAKEFVPAIISTFLMLVALCLSLYILNNGNCILNFTGTCLLLRGVHFGCLLICVLYRLVRMTPIAIVLLKEHCFKKQMARDRIRLAVFHYLHHMMKETHFSQELFSREAYKVVKKEFKKFNSLIDGLMRLDFKEHVEEIDVVPVIKTRQAVRMMSYVIEKKLEELKAEGFLPAEAEEQWDAVCFELRERAESILVVAQLDYSCLLKNVRWLASLTSAKRDAVCSLLVNTMKKQPVVPYQPRQIVKTGGNKMWFIKKGICKTKEWLPGNHHHHEFYLSQGEFVGERNLLLMNNEAPKLPITFPKRRYETTTYCEMIEIDANVMAEILRIDPGIYIEMSKLVQSDRFIVDIKHIFPHSDITPESFWAAFQTKKGRSIGKLEKVEVADGSIVIVGCWTNVVMLSPTNFDKNCHVRGPAVLWVEPADERANGMIYKEKNTDQQPTNVARSTEEAKSAISLIHNDVHQVLEQSQVTQQPTSIGAGQPPTSNKSAPIGVSGAQAPSSSGGSVPVSMSKTPKIESS